MSSIEDNFAFQLKSYKIPFEREVLLVPGRKWRVDFLISPTIVVEVEGGIWSGGRHTRGLGFQNDAEKHNCLTMLGYRIFRITADHIKTGRAVDWVRAAM